MIERAANGHSSAIENVWVDHGAGHMFVAEQFLNCAYVVPIFQELRCEGMTQDVGSDPLLDHSYVRRARYRALNGVARQVMTGEYSGPRVGGEPGGRKFKLPGPNLYWPRGICGVAR